MTFLFELSQWGFFLFIITFIITVLAIPRTDNKLLLFGPLMLVGLIWAGSMYFSTEDTSASLESFCSEKGFSNHNYNNRDQSYCLDQDNGYLIEQEVRMVNDRWLLVKREQPKEVKE